MCGTLLTTAGAGKSTCGSVYWVELHVGVVSVSAASYPISVNREASSAPASMEKRGQCLSALAEQTSRVATASRTREDVLTRQLGGVVILRDPSVEEAGRMESSAPCLSTTLLDDHQADTVRPPNMHVQRQRPLSVDVRPDFDRDLHHNSFALEVQSLDVKFMSTKRLQLCWQCQVSLENHWRARWRDAEWKSSGNDNFLRGASSCIFFANCHQPWKPFKVLLGTNANGKNKIEMHSSQT